MAPKKIVENNNKSNQQQSEIAEPHQQQQQQQRRSSRCSFTFFVFILSIFLPFALPITALLFEIHYPEFHSPHGLTGRVNPATGELLTKTGQGHMRFVNDFCNFDRLHCCNGSVPLKFPSTIEEIQQIVKHEHSELKSIIEKYPGTGKKIPSPLIRVVGGGHAINNLVCSSPDSEYPPRNRVILSLDLFTDWKGGIKITPVIKKNNINDAADIAAARAVVTATAWAPAGLRLKHLNDHLWEKGYALFNTGMIQEQSLAGVISTAVHGTGIENTAINERVVSIDVVLANGTLATFSKTSHPHIFKHARMHLGLFGIVVGVEFEVRDRYYVRRTENLATEAELMEAVLLNDARIKAKLEQQQEKNKNNANARKFTRTQAWWFQNSHKSLIQDMSEEYTSEQVESVPELKDFLRNPYIVTLEKLVTDFFYLVMTSLSVHFPFLTPLIHQAAVLNHGVERNYLARSYDSFTAPGVNYHSVRYSETELFVPADSAVEAWQAFKEFLVENTVSSFSLPFFPFSSAETPRPKQQRRENNPKFCNINSLSPLRTVAADTIPLSPMFAGGSHNTTTTTTNYVAFSFTLVYR